MLADEIVAHGYFCMSPQTRLRRAAETIGDAGRFLIDRNVLIASDFISEATPSALVRGLPLCRLPYPATWFEYAGHDRPKIANGGTVVPHRVGLLCESNPARLQEVTVNLFWQHRERESQPQLSPVAMTLDLSTDGDWAREEHFRGNEELLGDVKDRLQQKIESREKANSANASEVEAARALSGRVVFGKSPYFEGEEAQLIDSSDPDMFERIRRLSQGSALSEAGLVLGLIMLLNTRNGTRNQTVNLRKLNLARVRRGVPPLFEYSMVTLRLGGRRSEATQHLGHSTEDIRAHLVRGHFKIRKSGIFWWSPHVRGEENIGTVEKAYKVTF